MTKILLKTNEQKKNVDLVTKLRTAGRDSLNDRQFNNSARNYLVCFVYIVYYKKYIHWLFK